MPEHQLLLDAFADARRTWDDLVALQPDVMAGSGNLTAVDMLELERRTEAHQQSVDVLMEALRTKPTAV